jgi:hypothetical protein
MSRWRAASASVIGTAHLKQQEPCQDASRCKLLDNGTLICAVADGAGSASRADAGARIAVEQFVRWACTIADPGVIERSQITDFLHSLAAGLAAEAKDSGAAIGDYAATLLGLIAAPDATICLQIGDGAIVIPGGEAGTYQVAFWPQHPGEFANVTNFVTQENAADVIELRIVPPVAEFAMFSDGLERLILNEATRSVHAPALRPIFDWFRSPEAEDTIERSRALETYLESEHINRRTSDDKSLVVAVLRQD